MRWLAVVVLLLPSCAFDMPPEPGARERCYDYVAAVRQKMEECGEDPAVIEEIDARNRAQCERTVLIHPLREPVQQCIDEIRRIECANLTAKWCSAFVETR